MLCCRGDRASHLWVSPVFDLQIMFMISWLTKTGWVVVVMETMQEVLQLCFQVLDWFICYSLLKISGREKLTWFHDECKPAQNGNRRQAMTSHPGPASALMMSFFLSGVSFLPALVQPEAPPPLLLLFTHLDPFWFGSVSTSLFLETYLYICISVSCWPTAWLRPLLMSFWCQGFKLNFCQFLSVCSHPKSIKLRWIVMTVSIFLRWLTCFTC